MQLFENPRLKRLAAETESKQKSLHSKSVFIQRARLYSRAFQTSFLTWPTFAFKEAHSKLILFYSSSSSRQELAFIRFCSFMLTPISPLLVLAHPQCYSKGQVGYFWRVFWGGIVVLIAKAACEEGTVTLQFLPGSKKPIEKALKSSDECETFHFSLERRWLLHKLVVFPFLLPTATSLLLTRQRNQDYSYTYCCPHSFFILWGIRQEPRTSH